MACHMETSKAAAVSDGWIVEGWAMAGLQNRRSRSLIPVFSTLLHPRGCEAAEFVEEVEDEDNLVPPGFGLRVGGLEHGKSFAVRVQVEVPTLSPICKLPFGPQSRPVGAKRISHNRVVGHHDLLIFSSEEQFLVVSRPGGKRTAAGRNLQRSAWPGERPHIYVLPP